MRPAIQVTCASHVIWMKYMRNKRVDDTIGNNKSRKSKNTGKYPQEIWILPVFSIRAHLYADAGYAIHFSHSEADFLGIIQGILSFHKCLFVNSYNLHEQEHF